MCGSNTLLLRSLTMVGQSESHAAFAGTHLGSARAGLACRRPGSGRLLGGSLARRRLKYPVSEPLPVEMMLPTFFAESRLLAVVVFLAGAAFFAGAFLGEAAAFFAGAAFLAAAGFAVVDFAGAAFLVVVAFAAGFFAGAAFLAAAALVVVLFAGAFALTGALVGAFAAALVGAFAAAFAGALAVLETGLRSGLFYNQITTDGHSHGHAAVGRKLTSFVADSSAGRWVLGGSFTRPEGPECMRLHRGGR